MTVLVWSERNELHDPTGSEHDCYVAAPLMCLVYGGKTSYPLGIYTATEREALERADDRPDEQGGTPDDADLGIKRRYGLAMHKPTEASLGEAWKVGRALSVGGNLSNFPAGDPLRRYAPTYTGGHRVCVIPTSSTTGLWLDPLAPWKYAGDKVTLAQVGLFAKLRAVSDLRYSMQNEYATTGGGNQPGEVMKPITDTTPKLIDWPDSTPYYAMDGTTKVGTAGANSGRYSPFACGTQRAFYASSVPKAFLALVTPSKVHDIPADVATPLAPGLYEVK